MKKIIFIANIKKNPASGIYKKIIGQCLSLSKLGECILICKEQETLYEERFLAKRTISEISYNDVGSISNMIRHANKLIKAGDVNILYYRLPLKPSVYQVSLFKNAKKNGAIVFYEIPTYPFFMEQVNLSKRKFLTFSKLMVDKIIFLFSKRYIDKIPIMIGSSSVKNDPKFIPIINGIDSTDIPITNIMKNNDDDSIVLIGVGMLTAYHGYERVIQSIHNYYQNGGSKRIIFHIVGDGEILGALKTQVEQLNVKENVVFHGILHGEKLDEIYNKAQIGIGALELYRRNADIDTTLKVVEYLVRGLPVITSGFVDSGVSSDFIYQVSNDNSFFDFYKINKFLNNFNSEDRLDEILAIREIYNWDVIMRGVIKSVD